MRTAIIFIAFSVVSLGCRKSEESISGIYLKSPSINTIDSLFIYADSLQPTLIYNRKVYSYKQKFYNKKTNELLFENNGTWWLDNNRIEFMHFYFDADNNPEDYSYSKEAIKNAVIFFSTEMNGEDIFLDKNFSYKKIK